LLMKINANRLLSMLLLCLSLCLALGGAWAEGCEHEEMNFDPNSASDILTESCPNCGFHAELHMPLLVVVEGTDYSYEPITTGKDEWDVPYNLIYVSQKVGGFAQLQIIDKPTAVGTYYVVPELPWPNYPRVFGKIVVISKDHVHSVGYQSSNNVITAACSDCGMSGTLTLNMSNANAGEAKPATLTTNGTWPDTLPTIVYYDDKGDPLSGLPQDAGEYYAAVTVGQYVAYQAFTLHAQAIEPANIPANRIVPNAPYGMAFSKQDIADGQYHVTVSKKNTDWNAIIAQLYDTQRAMTIWQTPHVVPYEGSTGFAYVSLTAEELARDPDAIQKAVDKLQAQHKENNIPGNRTLSMRNIGGYTPENGLFEPYMDDEKFLDVLGWYKNGKLFAVELLSTMVDIDDKSSFTITADTLPAENILPATNLSGSALDAVEYAVTDGAVSYRADSCDAVNASTIETTVLLPQAIASKAATCEISYDAFKKPITAQVETIGGKSAVRISSDIPANNSASGYSYSLIFKDAQGVYVKAYALTVTLRTGEPVPFPLYHADWSAIPASRLTLQVSNTSM
ncbi:MAG: hypothetical protein IIX10_06220, partial [Clostridia bacterium]|nr:hypothetical protein [Clostridia bacterium]